MSYFKSFHYFNIISVIPMLAVCLYVQCITLYPLWAYFHVEAAASWCLRCCCCCLLVHESKYGMANSFSSFSIHEPNKCFLCLHLYRIYWYTHRKVRLFCLCDLLFLPFHFYALYGDEFRSKENVNETLIQWQFPCIFHHFECTFYAFVSFVHTFFATFLSIFCRFYEIHG